MSRTNFYATTALGLCLAMAPLKVAAQSFTSGAGEAMFVPSVQACVDAPSAASCDQISDLVIDCAADLERTRCEMIFEDPDTVFDDSAQLDQARSALVQASAVIDQESEQRFVEAETAQASEAEEAGWAEADAAAEEEETVAEEEVPEVEAEAEAEVEAEADVAEEAAAETETEAEAEARLREALEAEESAAEETSSEPEAEIAEEPEAEAPSAEAPSDEAEAPAAEAASSEEAAAAAEVRRNRRAERERLRADAEALAEEEPELIVEDAPAEEFVASDEAPRELDADEQSALDRLMEAPEVSSAVSVLGAMLELPEAEETREQPDVERSRAAAALRRERRGERAAEEEAGASDVTEDQVTADEIRTSRDDFDSRFAMDFDAGQARSDNRRDLERAGLVALGALAVGMIVSQNRVVARSDERVVVMDNAGDYAVWRDDDAILRQEGSQRRIERYEDGSTLTRWEREDGSRIVTIRDATGRLLVRERILADGTSIPLVDDMRDVEPVVISTLPPPRTRELRISQRTDPELALALLYEAEADARALDRSFTLRQIRELREVRELVPVLSPDPITFETNRANVRAEEAPKLAQVGRLMEQLIAQNPRELFLIEGYTDATGAASYNLALSDRRAESVALALTEFFVIPPENLVIQGYGERHLRIPTAAAEERNRRVAIRRISPLLGL
ncbi:OmpA family protein [Pararhodobacter sp.]|uniref:OmpA family protein n=1 Tax=Pararhodobacter sp. TaxID=2127056 RepID=UPI002FDCF8C4